jgi:uncharacterized cupin superfamily protein
VNTIDAALLTKAAGAELEDRRQLAEATGDPIRRRRGVPDRLKSTWHVHETVRKVYSIF